MKRRLFLIKLSLVFTSLVFISFTALAIDKGSGPEPRAKFVFLFIGDGMGQAQVNLTQAYLSSLEGHNDFKELTFTEFPQTGFVSTYANNRLITCSAAAGTALATGHKTNIDRISMDPEGKEPFTSIAETAKEKGFKIGIITTVSIDHATPAVFYAHQPDRDMYFEIGVDLTNSDFDYFAGGGFKKPTDSLGGKLVNLVDLAAEKGYKVVNTREAFDQLKPGDGKTLVLSPRPAAEAAVPYALDMNPEDLTLADFTARAINLLSNDHGFFMMIEGGKIDWACHDNDAATTLQEVISMDKAIENAYSFYQKHPDETLIIVTADHETGGLSLGNSKTKYDSRFDLLKYQKSSMEELSKIVAQFRVNKSGNPQADFDRMMKIVETDIGLNSEKNGTLLTAEEIDALRKKFNESVYGTGAESGTYGAYEKFIPAAISLLAEKSGVNWGTGSHTCVNVPVYAIGAGAEKFSGNLDNTDIPRIIGELMGVW
jgi:alkaline phosphatase